MSKLSFLQDGSIGQEEYKAAMVDVRGAIEALEERQQQDREWMGMEIEDHPLTKLQRPDAREADLLPFCFCTILIVVSM